MNIIYEGKGTGKTTKLIQRSASERIPIVTLDQRRAWQIAQMAKEMGLNIIFPLTVDESLHHSAYRTVLIDDADQILQQFFRGLTIDTITMTKEEPHGAVTQPLTSEGQWTPAMLAVWGVAMDFLHNEPEPEFAELTLGEYQYEIARRMVEAAKS